MPTRWSAQIPENRSSMPFCSLGARPCPVSPRSLSQRTGQILLVPSSRMRKCLKSQLLLTWLPRVRAQRGWHQRGLQKHQRREHPLLVWATPGMAFGKNGTCLLCSLLKLPLNWMFSWTVCIFSVPDLVSAFDGSVLWPCPLSAFDHILRVTHHSGLWNILNVHNSKY